LTDETNYKIIDLFVFYAILYHATAWPGECD
jgi:hypothetical protein